MAITIEEKANGRSGDIRQRQVVYVVKGTDSDIVAIDSVLDSTTYGVPITWDGLAQQTIAVEQQGPTIWYATVTYGSNSSDGGGPTAGSITYSFETSTESVRIMQSLQTVSVTPTDGISFQGGINIREDKSFEGVDIPVPVSSFSYDFKLTSGTWNATYIANVEQAVGKVNSDLWHGRNPGEVMLVGVAGSESTDGQPTLSFRFKFQQNTTVNVPGIGSVSKDGHDYLWVYREKVAENTNDDFKVLPKAKAAYVERLFQRVSFTSKLGF